MTGSATLYVVPHKMGRDDRAGAIAGMHVDSWSSCEAMLSASEVFVLLFHIHPMLCTHVVLFGYGLTALFLLP